MIDKYAISYEFLWVLGKSQKLLSLIPIGSDWKKSKYQVDLKERYAMQNESFKQSSGLFHAPYLIFLVQSSFHATWASLFEMDLEPNWHEISQS